MCRCFLCMWTFLWAGFEAHPASLCFMQKEACLLTYTIHHPNHRTRIDTHRSFSFWPVADGTARATMKDGFTACFPKPAANDVQVPAAVCREVPQRVNIHLTAASPLGHPHRRVCMHVSNPLSPPFPFSFIPFLVVIELPSNETFEKQSSPDEQNITCFKQRHGVSGLL